MEDTGYRSCIWMQLQVYEWPREQILPMLRQKCLYYVSNKTGAKFMTSFYLAVLNSYASTKCLTSLTNEEMLIFGMPTQS